MSWEEFIFPREAKTSQQAEVEAGPGDHSEVDREVNLRQISGEVTDTRLKIKTVILKLFEKNNVHLVREELLLDISNCKENRNSKEQYLKNNEIHPTLWLMWDWTELG